MENTKNEKTKHTLKKIGSIVLDVLIVFIFAIALIAIIGSVNKTSTGVSNVFGYCVNSVQSDSMSGTFEKGDLVIGKIADENTEIVSDSEDYKDNSIISFYVINDDETYYVNTHRVIGKYESNGLTYYITQGDNRERCPQPDSKYVARKNVICVYTGHIPLLGGFIDFLKEPLGFILIVVLPLSLVIIYEGYRVIKIYMDGRKVEMVEAAKSTTSDDVKEAIIAQYLAEQQGKREETDIVDSSTVNEPPKAEAEETQTEEKE